MKMQDMKMQHTGSSHVAVIKLEQSSNVHDMTNTANCQVMIKVIKFVALA